MSVAWTSALIPLDSDTSPFFLILVYLKHVYYTCQGQAFVVRENYFFLSCHFHFICSYCSSKIKKLLLLIDSWLKRSIVNMSFVVVDERIGYLIYSWAALSSQTYHSSLYLVSGEDSWVSRSSSHSSQADINVRRWVVVFAEYATNRGMRRYIQDFLLRTRLTFFRFSIDTCPSNIHYLCRIICM